MLQKLNGLSAKVYTLEIYPLHVYGKLTFSWRVADSSQSCI